MVFLAQITPPPDLDSPYAWFLVLVLGVTAYLGKRYLDDAEGHVKALRDERNQAIASLAANTQSLDRAVGVIESQGKVVSQSIDRNHDAIASLSGEVRRLGDSLLGSSQGKS